MSYRRYVPFEDVYKKNIFFKFLKININNIKYFQTTWLKLNDPNQYKKCDKFSFMRILCNLWTPGVKSTSKLWKVYPRASIPLDALAVTWGVYVTFTLSHYTSRIVKSENIRRSGTILTSTTNSETVSYISLVRRRWMAMMAHTWWGLLLGQEVESSSKPSVVA